MKTGFIESISDFEGHEEVRLETVCDPKFVVIMPSVDHLNFKWLIEQNCRSKLNLKVLNETGSRARNLA
jgi:hypothetical protein